jgi:hypothetical protein
MSESEPVLVAFLLSDSAIVEANTNKLSLIGCFSQFNLPVFPSTVASFYATIMLTNLGGATELAFSLQIAEPKTGHILCATSGKMERSGTGFDQDQYLEIPFSIPPVTFHQPGKYEIKLLLNGEEFTKRPITVNLLPKTK